jgi:F-box protein 18 (helicase)
VKGYKFDDLLDLLYLFKGLNNKIKNKYISSFYSYGNLVRFAEDTNDIELKAKIKIIDKYENAVEWMINAIYDSVVDNEKADIILSTAHKAKGSEFYKVKIADDFPPLIKEGRLVDLGNMNKMNLIFNM